jgi:hypothetical protein
MSISPISAVANVNPTTARRWLLACLVATVMIPSIGHAQLTTADSAPTTLMAIESGLHWVGDGAVSVATVSDAQTSTAFASVRLELRDPAGRLVAGTTARLGRGTPAQLRFPNKGLKQLSLVVKVTGFRDSGHAPVTIWEDISPAGSITLGGSCGPMGGSGGGQHMCQGFRLTADQADPWQP